jgi:N-acetyl-alpha-D-muramate 1-phosphate uridylyltransferase
MKAFIFAAGLGTRLAPLTNDKPKALVEVNGVPMLQSLIEKLIRYNCNYLVINTFHFADKIMGFLNSHDFGIEIHVSDERNALLNTGGGLKNAQRFFNPSDTFLVHNVDIFSDIDFNEMINFHLQSGSVCTMAVTNRESSRCLLFDDDNMLCGWRSKKTSEEIIVNKRAKYHEFAFSGIYVFNYKIFNLIHKQGAFEIIPELLDIAKTNRISAFIQNDKTVIDLVKI